MLVGEAHLGYKETRRRVGWGSGKKAVGKIGEDCLVLGIQVQEEEEKEGLFEREREKGWLGYMK